MTRSGLLLSILVAGCTSSAAPSGTYSASRMPANHDCGSWPAAQLIVIGDDSVTVNGVSATNVHIDPVKLSSEDQAGSPNVMFTGTESGVETGVGPSTGTLAYMLWANDTTLSGRADAMYQTTPASGPVMSCTMTWSIEMP